MNGSTLDRVEEVKLVLGVWLTVFIYWDNNTREVFRNAYSRITMITNMLLSGGPFIESQITTEYMFRPIGHNVKYE